CFFARRRRHTRFSRDWSSDVCSSDLGPRTARGVAMKPKSWRESYTELKEIVVPPHCNHHGTVFGGHILALIDQVAGVTAMEHCEIGRASGREGAEGKEGAGEYVQHSV